QKLIITTSPAKSSSDTVPPPRDSSVKLGAGPEIWSACAANASSTLAAAPKILFPSILVLRIALPRSEEERHADVGLEVVHRLLAAEHVEIEDVVPNVRVHGEPVERQQPQPHAEVQREPIVARELRVTHAAYDVKRHVHRTVASDEALARQHVVAQGDVIVGVLPLGIREQLRSAAQPLVARRLGVRAPGRSLDEETLGHVVCESGARDRVHAEILDADL